MCIVVGLFCQHNRSLYLAAGDHLRVYVLARVEDLPLEHLLAWVSLGSIS
jgi:hypothetical protein